MPGTPTPIYGLVVPTVAGDQNAWGAEVNGDLAQLDTLIGLPRIKRAVVTTGVLDLAVANFFEMTVTAPVVVSFATVPTGTFASRVVVKIINGGSNTITWPGSIVWLAPSGTAPVLRTAGVDFLGFWTNDNGTTWYGESTAPTVTLPSYITRVGQLGQVSTTSLTEVSLGTIVVPAGKLATNGDALRVTVNGRFQQSPSAGDTATIKVKFGAATLSFVGVLDLVPPGRVFFITLTVTRLSATTQIVTGVLMAGLGAAPNVVAATVAGTETLANPITLDFRGTAGTPGGASASHTLFYDSAIVEAVTQ